MSKTQYYTASSLDGFLADADGSLDWLLRLGDTGETSYPAFVKEVGALAMGSQTYEWVRAHLLGEAGEASAWPYDQPAWVFSSRPREPWPGADLRFVSGDVRPVHREMVAAAGGKNVWIVGGGELAGQFRDHGLLDELIVQIAPVTLGGGAPLLPRRIADPPLRLLSSAIWAPFVEVRYEVPKPGGGGTAAAEPTERG